MSSLERLQAEPVVDTARRVEERIGARFPERGLQRVARELVGLIEDVAASPVRSHRRIRLVRAASRTLIALVAGAAIVIFSIAVRDAVRDGPAEGFEWLPLIETSVNDLIFASIAVWFLWSLPHRLRRSESLRLLHRLRSLAHIVDMHQLTKDPERLRDSFQPTTKSAEPMDLDYDGLEHYLDYCSELLSLIGKAAALCAEESEDPLVLDTVSTVETLTTGLSRKIWQKITVLDQARDR